MLGHRCARMALLPHWCLDCSSAVASIAVFPVLELTHFPVQVPNDARRFFLLLGHSLAPLEGRNYFLLFFRHNDILALIAPPGGSRSCLQLGTKNLNHSTNGHAKRNAARDSGVRPDNEGHQILR